LTNWLFHDVLKMPATPILNEAGQPSDVLTGVATLSDDEIDRLLQQKMAGTGNMAGTAR
jgi:hypothetical protein